MNANDHAPTVALSPGLLAAVAALAHVAAWCVGVLSAPRRTVRSLPDVRPVVEALPYALAEPTAAAFDDLGAVLTRWCFLAGTVDPGGDPAAEGLIARAADACERVRLAAVEAHDAAAGRYDGDPSADGADVGAEVPDAPPFPTCDACGERPPVSGDAGSCFTCAREELEARQSRPDPSPAAEDDGSPWLPVRSAA